MKFSVIYSFDCAMDVPVSKYMPSQRRLFDMTERSDGQPDDWCGDLWGGKCKHRKLCALLTREQFERFLSDVCIYPEDVETMGSLGAPGFGYGHSPAISFSDHDQPDAILSAYVTPIIEVEPRREVTPERSEQVWQRVRRAVLNFYGA